MIYDRKIQIICKIICKYLHYQYDRKSVITKNILKFIKISSIRKDYFRLGCLFCFKKKNDKVIMHG